jgi:hypothetical protein
VFVANLIWCFITVDDFVQILYTIPINDSPTTYSICDDTLGGLTAIDPRKFADEFIRRRKIDSMGGAPAGAAGDQGGWSTVGGAAPGVSVLGGAGGAGAASSFKGFETTNSFTVVSQKAGKKKKK